MADPNNIKSIFVAASEKPHSERAAFLDQATAGDAALRVRIEALLKAHDNPDSFLKEPAAEFGATIDLSPAEHSLAERPGTLIGPYKLLEQIGEGGMGVVYMADQQAPVRRRVALKIIKAGMDTRQVIARFEAERQALALMDHSNIARVLDAGATESGRPYFVMELVRGVPITEYCDQHNLSIRNRLELFAQVCQAVQHAHQKGLIHRDIKPSNVLVSTQDDRPVAKVIDFGVAKAMQGQLTDRTLFTEFQHLVGTPAYMSPEQAGGSLDIDTRSDVYSLGVLLYELLAGTPPFDPKELRSKTLAELQRIIREVEPPTPSTRLKALDDTLATVAAQRSVEPRKLASIVRGELDWIVMKALEKDRTRRYETPGGLARDIERYLRDEPVLACPPSAVYRFRKFARRNKAALFVASAGVAALLMLVAGLATSNYLIDAQRAKAESERKRAEENLLRATVAVRDILFEAAVGRGDWAQLPESLRKKFTEKTVSYYQSLQQESSIPSLQYETAIGLRGLALLHESLRDPTQGERFARQAVVILDRLATEHRDVVEYRHQQAYGQYVLAGALKHAKRQAEAEAAFRRSFELYEALIAERSDRPDFFDELTNCYMALTGMLADRGALQEKEAVSQRFLKLFAQQPLLKTDRQLLGESYRKLASRFTSSKRYDEALAAANIAVETVEQLAAQLPYSAEHQELLGFCLRERSAIHREGKRYAEAESDAENAVKQFKQLIIKLPDVPEYRTGLAGCLKSFAKLKLATGEADQSLTLYREAVRLQPDDASTHNELGNALHAQRKFPEAVAAYGEAIRFNPSTGYRFNRAESMIGARRFVEAEAEFRDIIRVSPRDAASHRRLGAALQEQGKLSDAEAAYREAIRLQSDHVDAYSLLVTALVKQGKFEEAIAVVRESVDDQPKYNSIFREIGWTFLNNGAYGPAEQMFRQSLDCSKRLPGDNRLEVARSLTSLAFVLRLNGELADAESMYREALTTQRKLLTGDHADVAFTLNGLGLMLASTNRLTDAEAMLREALHMRIRLKAALVGSHNNLVMILAQQDKLDEAIVVCRQAIELKLDNAGIHSSLAGILRTQGKVDESDAAWRKAIALAPENPDNYNFLAWSLATDSEPRHRDPPRAVELAKKAVELAPQDGAIWNTLGVAQYRAREWQATLEGLQKAMDLRNGGDSSDWFFLAMAHWQLDHKDEARKQYDKAVEWMDKNQPKNEELLRFRAEAADLLGLSEPASAADAAPQP